MLGMSPVQRLALTIAILGLMSGSTTQLTDILSPFGSMAPLIVKEIVSVSTFVSGVLGIFVMFMTGQSSQVQAVRAMPGVENILVNAKANPTLAKLAVDPAEAKIEIKPGAEAAVQATAKGN